METVAFLEDITPGEVYCFVWSVMEGHGRSWFSELLLSRVKFCCMRSNTRWRKRIWKSVDTASSSLSACWKIANVSACCNSAGVSR